MKILVTYSSRTGNTKKIAKAIYDEFKEDAVFLDIDEVDSVSSYDYVFVGGFVDKGIADKKA